MSEEINSRAYWDNRFANDWEINKGPEQSRFFVEVALDLMPKWFKSYIENNQPSVCDWGCAQGDGTNLLASLVGRNYICGVDFSNEAIQQARVKYPDLRFEAQDWINESIQSDLCFDVVFSSNTVEHFYYPYQVIEQLAQHAKDFVVLMLPYREINRHPEHFFTFSDEYIAVTPSYQLNLVFAKSKCTSDLKNTLWLGEQVLLIYAHQSAAQRLGLTLADLDINNYQSNLNIDNLNKKIQEIESQNIQYADHVTEIKLQLNDSVNETSQLRDSVVSIKSIVIQKEEEISQMQGQLQLREKSISQLEEQMQSRAEQINHYHELNDKANKTIAEQQSQLHKIEADLEEKVKYIMDKELYIAGLKTDLSRSRERITTLLDSASWRITAPLRVLGSWRYLKLILQFFQKQKKQTHAGNVDGYKKTKSDSVKESYQDFNPYEYVTSLKPILVAITDDNYSTLTHAVDFTMICTVLNEAKGIDELLQSLSVQTLQPREIIFVDGGSKDETVPKIEQWAKSLNIAVRIIIEAGATIARGRNIAIQQSSNEVIVIIDAGCRFNPDYCRALVGAYTGDAEADMVGGVYLPIAENPWSKYFIPDWSACRWDEFLPSSRSLLIRKSRWDRCGGYPEYLSKTGEDTLFDINYRRYSSKWIFNLNAIAYWVMPVNEQGVLSLAKSYGIGDGESGFGDFRFYSAYKHHRQGLKSKMASKIESAVFQGYLEGRSRRSARNLIDKRIVGVVILLSGVPISDSGGGQRCTQLALEFAHQGYKVIFVNIYPSFEKVQRLFLDIDPALIDLYSLSDFNVEDVLLAYEPLIKRSMILVEFPHPELLPILRAIQDRYAKPCVVYDYIDNWNTTLGWTWYTPEIESEVISLSSHLVASAQTLRKQLADRERRGVHLIPNAFNDRLFDNDISYQMPEDIKDIRRPIIMYIGALWGSWFDWDLLVQCANELSGHEFVLIGNVTAEIESNVGNIENVRFLGLKPQRELPGYLHYADVCIIPFKNNDVTHFVNPLKVYEYLAMHVPVVTTAMSELKDIPGVKICDSYSHFISELKNADKSKLDVVLIASFLAKNNWKDRVSKLIALAQGRNLPSTDFEELNNVSDAKNPIASWQGVLSISNRRVLSKAPLAVANGVPHEDEIGIVKYFQRRDDLLLDVGANVGQTVASVRATNSRIPIICFEPNPYLATAMERASETLGRVEVKPVALSAEPGEKVLWIPAVDGYLVTPLASFDLDILYEAKQLAYINSLSSKGDVRLFPVKVTMQCGDDFLLNPTIIKIDVEGFEIEVIAGLQNTLMRMLPLLIIERSYKSRDLVNTLHSYGYGTYRYDENGRLRDIALNSSAAAIDEWPLNIIFIHKNNIDDVRVRGLEIL